MSGRTRNTNQRSSSRRVEQTTTPMMDLSKTVEPGLEDSTTPVSLPEEPNVDEYGNKLVYLGYRKEDYFCPEGYVLDIYGYCRYICVFVYVLPSSAHSVDHQFLDFIFLHSALTVPKGRLISKCLFGVFKFFQKTDKNKST